MTTHRFIWTWREGMSTVCDASGKTKYRTEQKANKVKMHIWANDPHADIQDLHVYLCPACHFYHVGHESYYKRTYESYKKDYEQKINEANLGE